MPSFLLFPLLTKSLRPLLEVRSWADVDRLRDVVKLEFHQNPTKWGPIIYCVCVNSLQQRVEMGLCIQSQVFKNFIFVKVVFFLLIVIDRHVSLRNECGQYLTLPSIFVHVKVHDYVPDR